LGLAWGVLIWAWAAEVNSRPLTASVAPKAREDWSRMFVVMER
jgi:hypothetical protein